MRAISLSLAVLISNGGGVASAGQPCDGHWSDQFATGEYHAFPWALAGYDDGTGPALYIGFAYRFTDSPQQHALVRMTDRSWAEVGGGGIPVGGVYTATPYDDGTGEVLVVAGYFDEAGGVATRSVAFWNGVSWTSPAGGLAGGVSWGVALGVFDDGTGPALYVGGNFTEAGGTPAGNVAKWDGEAWSALGGGVSDAETPIVHALAEFDDGHGWALYAAGTFSEADGAAALNIARWDGTSWSDVGGGSDGYLNDLVVYDEGAGPALYVGGAFQFAGGVAASNIARWDGAAWSPVGTGMDGQVTSQVVFDDGGGPALYACGLFGQAGGVTAQSVARWDGVSWSAVGEGVPGAYVLAVHDDGFGVALYAATNYFTYRWDGIAWRRHHGGVGGPAYVFDDEVRTLAAVGERAAVEPGVYAGGSFSLAGSVDADNVTRFDGERWHPVGDGLECDVNVLQLFDDGSADGAILFAGTDADDCALRGVVRWDGETWTDTGAEVTGAWALAVFDDGAGPALYAAGDFPGSELSRWDGMAWTPVADPTGIIHALAVHDDGTGPALYVGGWFDTIDGVEANGIARFDGTAWSEVGDGISLGPNSYWGVRALVAHDDGSGPALYAGGLFLTAGGVPVNHVARWDGHAWSSMADGVIRWVHALAVVEDADGVAALYAGGQFDLAGGTSASRVARWNGALWSPLDVGIDGNVWALTPVATGRGEALFAGGNFTRAGGLDSKNVARWTPCPEVGSPAYRPCRYDVELIEAAIDAETTPTGMNDLGDVVGTADGIGFLWHADDGFTPLPFSPADVNNDRLIVGSTDSDQAVLYHEGTLTNLPVPPGTTASYAVAVNGAGEVVGYAEVSFEQVALYWHDDVVEVLSLSGSPARALDINDSATIVGEVFIDFVRHGFVREADGTVTVMPPVPGGTEVWPRAVNNAGIVAGRASVSVDVDGEPELVLRGFLWDDGDYSFFEPLPGDTSTSAIGLNDAGVAVGFSWCATGSCFTSLVSVAWQDSAPTVLAEAVPWDLDLFIDLPRAINNAGQIAVDGWTWGHQGGMLLSPVVLVGDIDGDCRVDVVDFLILLFEWGRTDSPADLNGDGIVDVRDFLLLLATWT